MEGIGKGLKTIVELLIAFSFCVGIVVGIGAFLFTSEQIKSSKKIDPELYIEIKNGVSDTTYIYERN